jgi:hypothetical protein
MSKFLAELLFGLARSFLADRANGFVWQLIQRAGAWLDTRINGRRTRLVAGLLLGVAAYAFFPIIGILLATKN